ncbi:hypothetical protein M7I_2817 [Glarea lozoyensis 74030]|uniref:Uncharacterized protein n=1 Tax=Glarea lozoyensis (strain ATCC 74030 / MF5533) TaxID=1104152 RepID=H0EJT5_GLAL7|nr:hypothetical protein M7I_2817 [Glarea lozoyensis 74030]
MAFWSGASWSQCWYSVRDPTKPSSVDSSCVGIVHGLSDGLSTDVDVDDDTLGIPCCASPAIGHGHCDHLPNYMSSA